MWSEKNINAFLAVFFCLLVLGFLFHQSQTFAGSLLGHGLGIVGSILILMTLIYPFRKRVLKKKGRQNSLNSHVTYGLIGPSLVVIHSAHKFSSLIGILVFLSLVLVVFSGIVGRYLYKKVNRSLREQKRDQKLIKARIENRKKEMHTDCKADETLDESETDTAGDSETYSREEMLGKCGEWLDEVRTLAEIEYATRFFDRLKTVFSRWIRIHYVISGLLFALMIVHIMTTIYYGLRWVP
ncbi:MAG: hypothetical protein U5L07_14370 [Desulfobacterales bacterium]|nr:hypothetical protein [Desulfobacterales bacterium]